ncbi:MAG TPA: alpha/beta fold hydrolase [Agitococcus sp.]|nr:alpha/beta fold hydrolase [Pseudomonadales bacterium]MCB1674181.1 alpha/beta fold hydrolase [Pseudomonadales bacterium]MCP5176594.1 alpha/beta fold hydrolase [Moraxellaceae bacterium]HQV22414.1 alpha/beta fold hydrolase [Agitococcus sp.]
MSATSYVQGQAGRIEVRVIMPSHELPNSVAVLCHPHPLYGGTMDNKVVTTIARAFKEKNIATVLFNFRGVGQSDGVHDHAHGEVDDLLAVITWATQHMQADSLYLAGFSFGSYVAAAAVSRLADNITLKKLYLIAPPVHHYAFNELNLPIAQSLVIQGDADEVVPAQDVFLWAEQQQLSLIKFEGCSHFFHGRLVELRQSILDNLYASLG